MKRNSRFPVSVVLLMGVLLISPSEGNAGPLDLSRPYGIGLSFVGTRQDASQIHGSGMGGGAELYLRYRLSPRLTLSGATGIFSVTDDMFKSIQMKSTLIPSVELRSEFNLMNQNWFRPFMVAGFHFFGTSTKANEFPESGGMGHDYRCSAILGFGAEVMLGPGRFSLIASGDYRYAFLASPDPKPQYWVMKAGISMNLGAGFSWAQQILHKEEYTELPADLFAEGTPQEMLTADEKSSPNSRNEIHPNTDFEKSLLENIQELKSIVESNTQQLAGMSLVMANQKKEKEPVAMDEISRPTFLEMYKEGLRDFHNMKYEETIALFSSLIDRFPDHVLIGNCYYWIGESYNALNRYREAIRAFDTVLNQSDSHKRDDALLMRGQMRLNLDEKESASADLRELLEKYPNSEYAPRARRMLATL